MLTGLLSEFGLSVVMKWDVKYEIYVRNQISVKGANDGFMINFLFQAGDDVIWVHLSGRGMFFTSLMRLQCLLKSRGKPNFKKFY